MALAVSALAVPALGQVTWEDVAPSAGIVFREAGEMHGDAHTDPFWPAFPEIMGGGACWFDYDRDGYDDLYLVNQVYNAENPYVDASWATAADPHNRLYRNNGDGTFADTSAQSGVDSRAFGYGCSAADFDGDGWVDLFVSNFGDNDLFRNERDGTFANVSELAGVAMTGACRDHPCMSTSSAWADYDGDGDLDLYVANYVDTNFTDALRGPSSHLAQFNFLHRNNGDGTFTEVAHEAGVAGNRSDRDGSKSLGVAWFDAELDGELDLYVVNDETPNDFYLNDGDGTFTDRSTASGLESRYAGMGLTAGDYDNDGLPDLYFTHYESEHNGFFRNRGDGTFENRSGEDDLGSDLDYVGWGTAFTDIDRDGDADIVAINGHTDGAAPPRDGQPWYDEPLLVYRNDPNLSVGADPWDRNWTDVSDASGPGVTTPIVGRGAAFGDYDLDGNPDIAVVRNNNESASLLHGSGASGNWLYLTLQQPGPNHFAIGARVAVEAGGSTQTREVQAGGSYLSQNSLVLDVGLGNAPQADRVTVFWPGGGTTVLQGLAAGQLLRIDRATGLVANDTLSPATRAVVQGAGGQDGWYRTPVNVTVAAEDRGVSFRSGLASTERALDGGAWQPYAGETFAFTEPGEHVLRMRSRDLAGNDEPVQVAHIGLDFTAPEPRADVAGEAGEEGWYTSEVRVTLGGSDAGGSGIGAIRYRIDGGAWQPSTGPVAYGEEGAHQLDYLVADRAGNEAPLAGITLRIDRTAPAVAFVAPRPGAVYAAGREVADLGAGPAVVVVSDVLGLDPASRVFHVDAAASDATSGVRLVAFQVDGEVVAVDREGPAYGFDWRVGDLPAGFHELTAIATDHAGHVRAASVVVLVLPATLDGLERTLGESPAIPAQPRDAPPDGPSPETAGGAPAWPEDR